MRYDVTIVGGGIVGLATALALTERAPALRLLVLEKEHEWAHHQTGHNSGVIHSGIYYKPGSLKAVMAKAGAAAMVEFCARHDLPYEVTGKVIVATQPAELSRLAALEERGRANGLEVRRLGAAELREYEPHCAGLAALAVPSTGIVDFKRVSLRYARLVADAGGELLLGARVEAFLPSSTGSVVLTTRGEFATRLLVNCAGLHSDRIARLTGIRPGARVVPFRGEYYDLVP